MTQSAVDQVDDLITAVRNGASEAGIYLRGLRLIRRIEDAEALVHRLRVGSEVVSRLAVRPPAPILPRLGSAEQAIKAFGPTGAPGENNDA